MINKLLQYITNLILAILIVGLFGCASGSNQNAQNSQPSYNQYQQQPQYAPAPARQDGYYYNQQQPAYTNSPYQYQQPASRYYSNPYAMPPQNQYPYYDGDQYYVPPTYYGGANRDNPSSSANQKY
ncbi:MAG: hypothetical protein V4612_05325 [Pseudomonadota bacterium]